MRGCSKAPADSRFRAASSGPPRQISPRFVVCNTGQRAETLTNTLGQRSSRRRRPLRNWREPRTRWQYTDLTESVDVHSDGRDAEALTKTGALQRAIFNSANFSSIAVDAKGVIQIFKVGPRIVSNGSWTGC